MDIDIENVISNKMTSGIEMANKYLYTIKKPYKNLLVTTIKHTLMK